ncbi:MAG TPA: FAD binding domain-containing protein [Candidatus Limnocylindria bacterium]|nr:FAD binding domain-containing protein [Candidatus Limnocylindria bacterium]
MLRLPRFRYVSPPTLEEAIRLRTEHADSSMYVAGGTDVYPKMKRRQFQPEVVISLGRVVSDGFADGTGTSFAEQGPLPPGLRIGANASLTAVSEHPKVREGYAALAQAASLISTPQLRNMGTIGGNICLDTRCNWYDQSLFWRTAEGFCMKTNAEVVCRVAPSSPRCLAVASADTVPALIALGASVHVAGPSGERVVELAECYRDDGIRYLTLAPGEVVTEVRLPPRDGWKSTYLKLRDRGSFDFPIAGLAAAVRWDGAKVAEARVAITALASRPVAVDASALVGTALEDDAIAVVADAVHKAARPMDNTSGTISQRKRASRVFAERALRSLRT